MTSTIAAPARPRTGRSRLRPRTIRALVGLVVLAALLYTWEIGYVGFASYYAAGARSMAASPRALLFGALDPAATTTLDKLSGFLMPQALAVRLLGFHPWVLALPQVVEGVVTVVAAFAIGHRWRGERAGLALAGLTVVTPVLAVTFGRPTEDALLTMCQVLAFAALQRSLTSAGLRWLLLSAGWIAVGFQAKMMQSWLLLPALVLVHLVGGRVDLRVRAARVALACGVCVAVSIAWMTAIQLVPAVDRPYIDGTTDDDVFSMVFGYDGFDRLLPGVVPGAVPQLPAPAVGGTRVGAAATSTAKLLLPQITTQVGWLLPLAAVGLAVAAATTVRLLRVRHGVDDASRVRTATLLGFAAWLLVAAVVLSPASVPHATYFAVIAVPVAALAVQGLLVAVGWWRTAPVRAAVLALAQAVWAAAITVAVPQLRPVAALLVVLGVVAAACLVRGRGATSLGLRRAGVASGLACALLGPALWSSFALAAGGGGSATDGYAGPRIGAPAGARLVAVGDAPALMHLHAPFGVPPDPRLDPADARLLRLVGGARATPIAFAADSEPIVVAVVLGSRASPLLLGGYGGRAPHPDLPSLHGMIRAHRLRFVLLQDPVVPAPASSAALAADRAWVRGACAAVTSGRFHQGSTRLQTLYDCGAAR